MAENEQIKRAGHHQWSGLTCLRYWEKSKRLIACIPSRQGRIALSYEGVGRADAKSIYASPRPLTILAEVTYNMDAAMTICANCPPEGCIRHAQPRASVSGEPTNRSSPARLPLGAPTGESPTQFI